MLRTRTASLSAAIACVSLGFAGPFPIPQALAQSQGAAPECFKSKRLSAAETLEVSLHQGAEDIPDIRFKWIAQGFAKDISYLKNIEVASETNWIAKHTTYGHYPLGARMNLGSFDQSTLSTNIASLVGTGPARGKRKLFSSATAQYSYPSSTYEGLSGFVSDLGWGQIQRDDTDVTVTALRKTNATNMSAERELSYIAGLMFRETDQAEKPFGITAWWAAPDTWMTVEMAVSAPQDIGQMIVELAASMEPLMKQGRCTLGAPLPPRREEFDDPRGGGYGGFIFGW